MKSIILSLFLAICALTTGQRPFYEQETVLATTNGKLYGTLLIADSTIRTPVAIIIPGSGATDQNGNSGLAMHTNAYQLLADELAKNNISTLRFDKRGIGKSYEAAIKESELSFDTFIEDVILWTNKLIEDKRFSDFYLIGHSQGSLIGMLTAQKTMVNGFISIAGAGYPFDSVLNKQLKGKLPENLYDESSSILSSLKKGNQVDSVSLWLYNLFRPTIQPYLISWIKYDPCNEISKLTVPSLIINGTTDIQVSTDNAEQLHKSSGNSKLILIENMNHVLKEAPMEQQANIATYNNGKLPVVIQLVEEIVGFIHK